MRKSCSRQTESSFYTSEFCTLVLRLGNATGTGGREPEIGGDGNEVALSVDSLRYVACLSSSRRNRRVRRRLKLFSHITIRLESASGVWGSVGGGGGRTESNRYGSTEFEMCWWHRAAQTVTTVTCPTEGPTVTDVWDDITLTLHTVFYILVCLPEFLSVEAGAMKPRVTTNIKAWEVLLFFLSTIIVLNVCHNNRPVGDLSLL